MHKRLQGFLGIATMGVCFQLVGCESNEILEIVATGVQGIVVNVSEAFFETVINAALEIGPGV